MPRFRPDPGLFRKPERDPEADQRQYNTGRPEWQATEWQRSVAQNLAGIGLNVEDIARVIGISENTLRKHLSEELALGRSMARAVVANSLFKRIIAGDMAAITFYMRTQMGWIEAKPGDTAPEKEIEELTDDDIRREIEAIAARQRASTPTRGLEAGMPE
jgi:predicted DNA-binding transcriptional regulator